MLRPVRGAADEPHNGIARDRDARRQALLKARWRLALVEGFSAEVLFLVANSWIQFLFCVDNLDIFVMLLSQDTHGGLARLTVGLVILLYMFSIALLLSVIKFVQVRVSSLVKAPRPRTWLRWCTNGAVVLLQSLLSMAVLAEVFLYRSRGIHVAGTQGINLGRYLLTGGDIRFVLQVADADSTFLHYAILCWVAVLLLQAAHWQAWRFLQLKYQLIDDRTLTRAMTIVHVLLTGTTVAFLMFTPSVPLFV